VEATLEMMERAGWRADQFAEHHAEVLCRFVKRSSHLWKLDLTAASRYGLDLGVLDEQGSTSPSEEQAGERWLISRLPVMGVKPRLLCCPG
jgi:hypothetical protein